MTPPRGRGRLDRFREQLSERDLAVLADLARLRLLTGGQLQRLHVHDGSEKTRARRTRSVLERLYGLRLLHRLGRQIGGVRAGSSGYVYALAPRGRRLLGGRGPAGGTRLRKVWDTSDLFTAHILAVSELCVRLRESARSAAGELLTFDAEPACWRWWLDANGTRVALKPDAFVVMADNDFEYRTFVEIDCATETRPTLRRKAEAYLAYWHAGVEQQRAGVFPKVIWQAPTPARGERISEVLAGLEAQYWQLFQVVTPDRIVAALSGGRT